MASERAEVTEFFAKLHAAVFKPRGFKKTRRTFTKTENAYAWALQFQGSNWNDAGRPWLFYLNAGIQFDGTPRRVPDKDFPMMHASMRLNKQLSSQAEASYEATSVEAELLVAKLQSVVEDLTTYFSTSHERLRERYGDRGTSYLGHLDELLVNRANG